MLIDNSGNTKLISSVGGFQLGSYKAIENPESKYDALRVLYSKKYNEEIFKFIEDFRQISNVDKPILLDLSYWPQGFVKFAVKNKNFSYNQTIRLSTKKNDADVQISLENPDEEFKLGSRIFLDYGRIELLVQALENHHIICRVVQGGSLEPGMEIHVPETKKILSIFDLNFINISAYQKLEIDYIILPNITSARQIAVARKKLTSSGMHCPWLIIKIDSKLGYENIKEILSEADGILISRKELSLTVEPALVPVLCKEMIQEANKKAKLSFISSEMLSSMKKHPTPTRAEVSDIANAVVDGTHAVILSEEISQSPYCEKALEISRNTIKDVEKNLKTKQNWYESVFDFDNEMEAVAFHAYKTAKQLNAKALVCITKEGNTALRIASYCPPIPILAVTFIKSVERRLSLVRGVRCIRLEMDPRIDEILPIVSERIKKINWLQKDDVIVLVSVSISSLSKEASNLFMVQKVS